MRHTASISIMRSVALSILVTILAGCASERVAVSSIPDRSPQWTKYTVAGSRIARRLDTFGNPATGTLVQTISEQELLAMPGNSLADKLSGNPGGISR
jgi:hypothetical protein